VTEAESATAAEPAKEAAAIVESAPVESEPPAAQTEVAMAETRTPSMPAPEPKAVQDSPTQDAPATGGDSRPAAADTAGSLRIVTSSQYREADIWLREAYTAYQAGDLQLALSRYNQVLEIDPMNRSALLGRAAIYVQQGRADAAIEDYQTLLLANPKDSLAMSSLLGVASYSPLETESQLKLMIRDEPDSPYLNFALANAYGAQGRWHDAQRHYFTALQNNPEDPNYAYNLAVSLEHISQPGSARTYYQRALDNIKNGLATFSPEVVGQRLEVLGKL
jgi:tetratricopeptide (TPR) repeat protein